MWSDLGYPWQACIEEAWAAFCAGSFPIGAVVVADDGKILAYGRNHLRDADDHCDTIVKNQLAHAEINALLKINHFPKSVLHKATLYTTLEPCPLCMGALYMSAVRNLSFAAWDVYGGSSNLLGKTPYLNVKPIAVHPPTDALLEKIIVAIIVAHTLIEKWDGCDIFFETQRKTLPQAVDYGYWLHHENWLPRMREEKRTAKEMYENLLFQSDEFAKQ